MAKTTVALERRDLEQIISEFTDRMDSYNHTADFFDDADPNLGDWILENVRDSAEAREIANNYKRIVDEITRQIAMDSAEERLGQGSSAS